jgi:predicted amidohydrolase YtcJ
MMKITLKLPLVVLSLLVVVACGQQESSSGSPTEAADLLLLNGKVYTVDPEQAWAEAVAVRGGKILAVGSSAQMSAYSGADTEIIDLAGKLLMPGMIDAHVHPAWGGVKDLFQCNFPFSALPEDIAATIAGCVKNQPESEWIIGGQWTSNFFVDHNLGSPAKWLDKVSGDKAVILTDDSGHNHWANSRALALLGIDANTADPAGGKILRDSNTGEANGVLEEASDLIKQATPEWTLQQYTAGAAYSVEQANEFGITGMKDASASAVEVEAFYALDEQRKLTMYVAVSLLAETKGALTVLDFDEFVRQREKYQSLHLHTNFVKIFLDGVPTESRSAAMLAPYIPKHAGDEPNYGVMHLQPSDLAAAVARLDELGFTVKIHAAGDRSVRAGLDAIEHARKSNGPSGLRHELAHGGYIDPSDIPRFAALNAVADFSPHIWFPSLIMDSAIGVLGERGQYYWPTRDLIDSKARLLIGSDWPSAVPDMNPWRGLEALVTRRDPVGDHPGALWPEQAVSLEEAIELFTMGGANALKLEAVTGSITVGKSADFIVLQNSLFDIPSSQISDTRVTMTFFEGELVYAAQP